MVTKESSLKVTDNSGAKWSKCIKVIGKSSKGSTGSLLLVTLSNFVNKKKIIKKRVIYLGLVVGVRYWTVRVDGSFFRFFINKILLFNRQHKYLGTRVYGGISKEVRRNLKFNTEKKHFYKIFSYTSLIL